LCAGHDKKYWFILSYKKIFNEFDMQVMQFLIFSSCNSSFGSKFSGDGIKVIEELGTSFSG
jgi:hypothetical protein